MIAPASDSPLLGAHMSIAGGLHLAALRGVEVRCTALQLFSHNSNQWAMKPLADEEIALWKETLASHPMVTMVHDSYLINLASPDEALFRKSREAFLGEALRCVALGIPRLVFHPGAHMGAGEDAGLDRVAAALDWVDERLGGAPVMLLVENTAGQGSSLGHRFEHLAGLLDRVRRPALLGFCIDTCHLLVAGYDFRDAEGYRSVVAEFDGLIGVERIRAFHLNDSKKDRGSRVDRHEHIGRGFVGTPAFARILHDPRFRLVPKVLETPKLDDMDRKNLALLRRLASLPPPSDAADAGAARRRARRS